MDDLPDLRKILAQNIRNARTSLHISQAKLAESAEISFSYLTDIERCKTWVSDKTLASIANALNVNAYQLLVPADAEEKLAADGSRITRKTADLIKAKKSLLKKQTSDAMDNLMLEIIEMYRESSSKC